MSEERGRFEHRDGTWSLFRNDRKAEDSHSDYNGTIKIDGQEYYLNGWVKEKKGKKFFSGTVKPKGQRSSSGGQQRSEPPPKPEDDEIPF